MNAPRSITEAPVLSMKNIETFYGPIMAIRGVSIEVPKGQIVTILGANGAGKTTLMKTVSGVMDPEKGQVVLEGQEIQGKDPDHIVRAGVAHVPEGREVFPFLTVHENLMMGAYTRKDRENIDTDIEMVFEYFPDPEGTPRSAGGHDVRRSATDAGDRARADGQTQGDAAGRAVSSASPPCWCRKFSRSSNA